MTTINDMPLRDAIYGLRATRIFDGTPIPAEHLDQILEATTMACSSGNTQPWELVVVTDHDLKMQIKAEMEIGFAPVDADRVQPKKDLVDGVGRPITGHAAIENLEKAAAIVVVCWNPDRGIRFTDEYEEMPDGSLKETREIPGGRGASLFPACQNMMLAARSFGVQSLFTTFFYLRYQEIKDILGIPPRIFMECAIFLGYADEELGDPKRRPLSEVAHINGWGKTYEVAG